MRRVLLYFGLLCLLVTPFTGVASSVGAAPVYLPLVTKSVSAPPVMILPNYSIQVFNWGPEVVRVYGEIYNATEQFVDLDPILAQLYGADGQLIGFASLHDGSNTGGILGPKDKWCFDAEFYGVDPSPSYSVLFGDIRYSTLDSPSSHAMTVLTSLTGNWYSPAYSREVFGVRGEIRNDTAHAIGYYQMSATTYDEEGTVTDCEYAGTRPGGDQVLVPGELDSVQVLFQTPRPNPEVIVHRLRVWGWPGQ